MKYYPLQEDFADLLVKSPRRRLKRSSKGLNSKGFRPFEKIEEEEVAKDRAIPPISLPLEQPLAPPFVLPPEEEWPIYQDLRTDHGWKYVLGSEGAEQSAASFITAFSSLTITNIIYKNVEQRPEFVNGKTNLYDIYCSDQDDNRYILEMQRNSQDLFLKRIVFYACRSVVNQVNSGEDYGHKSVIVFSVVDFSGIETPTANYHNIASLRWESADMEFEDTLKLHVIELRKFNKGLDELVTLKDKWMYVMKHMGEMTEIPAILDDEIFRPVFKRALFKNLNDVEKMQYFIGIDHEKDLRCQLASSKREGKEEGIDIGVELEKGRAKEELIRNLLTLNFSEMQMVSIAQLTIADFRKIRAKLGI